MTSFMSRCNICYQFFDSRKELKDHIDGNHRMIENEDIVVTSREAEIMVENILFNMYNDDNDNNNNDKNNNNRKILAVSIINKKSGNILAAESRQSFKEVFGERINDDDSYRVNPDIAIAMLGVVSLVKDIFGEPQAIITVHKDCKLMLLSLSLYNIVIGLVLDRLADVYDDKIANRIERVVADALLNDREGLMLS